VSCLEAIDGGGPRLLQRDAQIEVAAFSGVRWLPHRLQRADEPVDVALIRPEDVQKNVPQGPARRRLRAQPLFVDPFHQGEQVCARPAEPFHIPRERGR